MNGRGDIVLCILFSSFLAALVAVSSGLQAAIPQYSYFTSTAAAVAASAGLRSFTSQVILELQRSILEVAVSSWIFIDSVWGLNSVTDLSLIHI